MPVFQPEVYLLWPMTSPIGVCYCELPVAARGPHPERSEYGESDGHDVTDAWVEQMTL
jgi:hypothetical protein